MVNSVFNYLILFFGLALGASSVYADSGDEIDRLLSSMTTFQASFTQTVMSESRQVLTESSGEVWLQRPQKFRWNYISPETQEFVGDGLKLWFYDHELSQVVVRDQKQAAASAPTNLLVDVGKLKTDYVIENKGNQGFYDMIVLYPKRKDSDFLSIHLGFVEGILKSIWLFDHFEQVTNIIFSDIVVNEKIDSNIFVLEAKEGVDVFDETR